MTQFRLRPKQSRHQREMSDIVIAAFMRKEELRTNNIHKTISIDRFSQQ